MLDSDSKYEDEGIDKVETELPPPTFALPSPRFRQSLTAKQPQIVQIKEEPFFEELEQLPEISLLPPPPTALLE